MIDAEKIENKVIDLITLSIDGRLLAFKPLRGYEGIDLVVKKKGSYAPETKEILLKINNTDTVGDKLDKNKNLYFIFVHFDEIKQKIDKYIWIKKGKDPKFKIDKNDLGKLLIEALSK